MARRRTAIGPRTTTPSVAGARTSAPIVPADVSGPALCGRLKRVPSCAFGPRAVGGSLSPRVEPTGPTKPAAAVLPLVDSSNSAARLHRTAPAARRFEFLESDRPVEPQAGDAHGD